MVLTGVLFVLMIMGGCAVPLGEGANIGKDKAVLSANLEAPWPGDPKAQYNVGDAYRCAPQEDGPFYDNRLATEWLCGSAHLGRCVPETRPQLHFSDTLPIRPRWVNANPSVYFRP